MEDKTKAKKKPKGKGSKIKASDIAEILEGFSVKSGERIEAGSDPVMADQKHPAIAWDWLHQSGRIKLKKGI